MNDKITDEEKKLLEDLGGDLNELDNESEIVLKKRGVWLTGFLALVCVANPFTLYNYYTNSESITQLYPKLGHGMVYFLSALCVVNILLVIGIWRWKKWGVYGFYAIVVIAFIINMYVGLGVVISLFGLCGALLIYLTTKKRWHHFN